MENKDWIDYKIKVRGRSKRELFSKLSITVEEAETEMWLELIIASKLRGTLFVRGLHVESLEGLKMLASIRKRLSS